MILSDDLKNDIEEILIDEKREHVLTSITRGKKGVKRSESDHNTIFTKLKFKWNRKVREKRVELFNLKNKACQEAFKEATTGAINNNFLSSVFDEEGNIDLLAEKFLKRLNKVIYQCFKKVRIKEKVDKTKEDLFKRWKDLKNKNDAKSKTELEAIERELADKYAADNFRNISEKTRNIDAEDGGMNSGSLWNLKRELFPKNREPLTAMKDPKTGNLLTTHDKINEAAVNVYKERLKNREMKKTLQHIREAKEKLCEKVLRIAKRNITPDWKMRHLEIVLKHLKNRNPGILLA